MILKVGLVDFEKEIEDFLNLIFDPIEKRKKTEEKGIDLRLIGKTESEMLVYSRREVFLSLQGSKLKFFFGTIEAIQNLMEESEITFFLI